MSVVIDISKNEAAQRGDIDFVTEVSNQPTPAIEAAAANLSINRNSVYPMTRETGFWSRLYTESVERDMDGRPILQAARSFNIRVNKPTLSFSPAPFEHNSVSADEQIHTLTDCRVQTMRDVDKLIFGYLQKLGQQGVLAGDEYEVVLWFAKSKAAPEQNGLPSAPMPSLKRKHDSNFDASGSHFSSPLESLFGSARANRSDDGALSLDTAVDDTASMARAAKRQKQNETTVELLKSISSNSHTQTKDAEKSEEPASGPHGRPRISVPLIAGSSSSNSVQVSDASQELHLLHPSAPIPSWAATLERPNTTTQERYVAWQKADWQENLRHVHEAVLRQRNAFFQKVQTISATKAHLRDAIVERFQIVQRDKRNSFLRRIIQTRPQRFAKYVQETELQCSRALDTVASCLTGPDAGFDETNAARTSDASSAAQSTGQGRSRANKSMNDWDRPLSPSTEAPAHDPATFTVHGQPSMISWQQPWTVKPPVDMNGNLIWPRTLDQSARAEQLHLSGL